MSNAQILAELTRVKAVFQLRAITAVLGVPAKGMEATTAGETGTGSTEGDSPVPQGIRPETGLHIQPNRLPEGVR